MNSSYVTAVTVTPDRQCAVSASQDDTLRVWELETEKLLATFTCDSPASWRAFSEAVKLILAGDAVGHLDILRLEKAMPKN
jgi:WD40 repeat protein